MIITNENLFLIVIGLIWIIGAVVQDLRRREVDNIWNFSLIGVAFAYRFSVSLFNSDYWFFINGVLGFFIFLVLGNLFYYSRIFAGGDAKLLIALGSVLPLGFNWIVNLKIFITFIGFFLLGGSIYVFIFSLFLVFFNWKKFKKEFMKEAKLNKKSLILGFVFSLSWIIFSLFTNLSFLFFGFIFLLFPLLFTFAKSVEESCLVKALKPEELTEGEWLYENIFVNGKKIKASWDGVSRNDLILIKKKYRRKIWIKQGIPFTPGFLIGFMGILYISMNLGWF